MSSEEGRIFEDVFKDLREIKKLIGTRDDAWKYEFAIKYYADLVESNLMDLNFFFVKVKELPAKIKAGMMNNEVKK